MEVCDEPGTAPIDDAWGPFAGLEEGEGGWQVVADGAGSNSGANSQAAALRGDGGQLQDSTQQQLACVSSLLPQLAQHPELDEEHVVQVGLRS
jgi:hypothetical protein